jgi:hypothetical protein
MAESHCWANSLARVGSWAWASRRDQVSDLVGVRSTTPSRAACAPGDASRHQPQQRGTVSSGVSSRRQVPTRHRDARRRGHTVAVVEAKFGAHLTDGQVSAYLEVLSRRSGPHTGALFVLVPPSRVVEAQRVLERATTARSDTTPAHAVVTWDEWLKVWTAVAEETSDAALASDLRQLTAMCHTLGGLVIPPLAGAAIGRDWQERASDLVKIVSVVTAQFLGSTRHRSLPMQGDLRSKPYTYRYLPPISQDTWVQVGVWGRFATRA